MNYEKIVRDLIEQYKASPVDMRGIGDAEREYAYLKGLEESYVRTIRDIDSLFQDDKGNVHLLEIGSFLGATCVGLKELGYTVSALDLPEFYESDSLKDLYEKYGIPFAGVNLRNYSLPYETESFDMVIMCEVMEHLNFNPLPVMQEVNRILKHGGYIYIAMPNQTSLVNRLRLLKGKSIHHPIGYYFKQLDRNDNMIVGIHWREYTLDETVEMVQKMGFEAVRKYYYQPLAQRSSNLVKRALWKVALLYEPFKSFHVLIGKKVSNQTYDFWFTEASS